METGKTLLKKAKKSKNVRVLFCMCDGRTIVVNTQTLIDLCKDGDYDGVKDLLEERREGVNVRDVNHKVASTCIKGTT